jgi:hypothetical protein
MREGVMQAKRHLPAGPLGRLGRRTFSALVVSLLARPLAADDARPTASEASQSPAPAQPPAPAADKPAPAPSAADAATVPDDDYKATKKIPARRLRQVLGCWQLDREERWTITRLDLNGAQVATKLLKRGGHGVFPDRIRRAALPATLMYDMRHGNFGFATPARVHPSLVVFKLVGSTLEASLYAKRSRKDHYAPTGKTATLLRCRAPKRRHAPGARPTTLPPRLK